MMRSTFRALCISAVAAALSQGATAIEFEYSGEIIFCTSSCDGIGALGGAAGGGINTVNSQLSGTIDLPVQPDGTFEFTQDDNVVFVLDASAPHLPQEDPVYGPSPACAAPNDPGQLCNPATVNPLPLGTPLARASGAGTVDTSGRLIAGQLTLDFDVRPLSNNDFGIVFDLADGSGDGTILGGLITVLSFEGEFAQPDDDGDSVPNATDNCLAHANPAQLDGDGDGHGNRCDGDFDNNCLVAVIDLGQLRQSFFSNDPVTDINGDGFVNPLDLGLFRTLFYSPPGPSAPPALCTPR